MPPDELPVSIRVVAGEREKPKYDSAAVVRHIANELRQPLRTVESIAFYLEMVLPRTDAKARRHLGKLQQEIQRANWILSDALYFLQGAPFEPQVTDLGELASKCLSECRSREHVRGSLVVEEGAPLVRLDVEQVRHMVRNIILFLSRQAGPEDPVQLKVRHAAMDVVFEATAVAPSCSEQEINALFEPFSSCLPEGSGLALASVRRIAEVHGARLEAYSNPSHSLTLAVAFPAAAEPGV